MTGQPRACPTYPTRTRRTSCGVVDSATWSNSYVTSGKKQTSWRSQQSTTYAENILCLPRMQRQRWQDRFRSHGCTHLVELCWCTRRMKSWFAPSVSTRLFRSWGQENICSVVLMQRSALEWLDFERLWGLENGLQESLIILRLRFRFAVPQVVKLGQSFGMHVELVDEMAQPPDLDLLMKDIGSAKLQISTNNTTFEACITQQFERRSSAAHERPSVRWFGRGSLMRSNQQRECDSERVQRARLLVEVCQTGVCLSTEQRQLQQFCCGSTWLNESTLILPVISGDLQICDDESKSTTPSCEPAGSSICHRVFRISAIHPDVDIQENYGDSMGSHVWDASILLSFALVKVFRSEKDSMQPTAARGKEFRILELGSGCGLFAAVAKRFIATSVVIATEKPESLPLLAANLDANALKSQSHCVPLLWSVDGEEDAVLAEHVVSSVDAVFAADVLYNWAAHEIFLATLGRVVRDNKTIVLLAHKHRNNRASSMIDQLLNSDHRNVCGTASADGQRCRWHEWHVERLAQLGKVDLLQLTRILPA